MAFTALLDADVLYPVELRSLLLHIAAKELYRVLWSDQVLEEMRRNISKNNPDIPPERLHRTVAIMKDAFPEASVEGYDDLIDVMTNHHKDRHVLAAAVRGGADVIVTRNQVHFPPESLQPYDLGVLSPDDFLYYNFDFAPDTVIAAMEQQCGQNRRPPTSVPELLGSLRGFAPRFVEAADAVYVEADRRGSAS